MILVNLYAADSYLTLEDNAQIFTFCNRIYKVIPIDSLNLLTEIIKSMNSVGYNMLRHKLDCITKKKEDEIFCCINTCISNLESAVVNINAQRRLVLDKAIEKSLKQILNKAIMVGFDQIICTITN